MSGASPRAVRALAAALTMLALAAAAGAWAQGASVGASGDQPIEITAAGGIEWDRNNRTYTARGQARAQKGELSVEADTLVAHYREKEGGGSEIERMEAQGNVRLVSGTATVTGGNADYDVASRTVTVTGGDLKLETETDLVTARDRLEYSDRTHEATATGDVAVVRDGRRLEAERVTAKLAAGADGKLRLATAEAAGDVRIATEREFVRADRATYDAERQVAVLTGGVKVTQDQNQLNGEYAEVDLKSGVSRLLGAAPGETGGRVKGLVLPGAAPEPGG